MKANTNGNLYQLPTNNNNEIPSDFQEAYVYLHNELAELQQKKRKGNGAADAIAQQLAAKAMGINLDAVNLLMKDKRSKDDAKIAAYSFACTAIEWMLNQGDGGESGQIDGENRD